MSCEMTVLRVLSGVVTSATRSPQIDDQRPWNTSPNRSMMFSTWVTNPDRTVRTVATAVRRIGPRIAVICDQWSRMNDTMALIVASMSPAAFASGGSIVSHARRSAGSTTVVMYATATVAAWRTAANASLTILRNVAECSYVSYSAAPSSTSAVTMIPIGFASNATSSAICALRTRKMAADSPS
jgi:hypothetical protein